MNIREIKIEKKREREQANKKSVLKMKNKVNKRTSECLSAQKHLTYLYFILVLYLTVSIGEYGRPPRASINANCNKFSNV